MKIAWITDPHLDSIGGRGVEILATQAQGADALLLGGDFGESSSWRNWIDELRAVTKLPSYFVLGNHDYYGSSIDVVQAHIKAFTKTRPDCKYLANEEVIELTPNTALVGHDCWGDARAGDFLQSTVELNDYTYINDLAYISKAQLKEVLHKLGDQAAEHFRKVLPAATKYKNVIILTHVPPAYCAGYHEGKHQDWNYAPHFVCQATEEPIMAAFRNNPKCQGLILCGHTHSHGISQVLPNLTTHNGAARYGAPRVQLMLDIE